MPNDSPTRRVLCALLAVLLASTGCVHAVRLDTTPSGATVAIDGVHYGETPVDFRERTAWERRYRVEITKPGFEPLTDQIRQSEWEMRVAAPSALLGLLTFGVGFVGLLWSRRARHAYHWDLQPTAAGAPTPAEAPDAGAGPAAAAPLPNEYPDLPEPDGYPDPDAAPPPMPDD